ncbi:MAG TPA: aspartate/glutamate racemase family protein [Cyclobacteriaceae bacterium]|nr:aspartate/glutamate racemase family protein [Cyclobacteriaceae bacterium]
MKVIGLIGGISWVSTLEYYKLINEGINAKLGDLNAAHCIIYSFNFQDIKRNNDSNNWDLTLKMVTDASMHLQNSGAKAIVLCANTMHLIANELQHKIDIPVIHIASATAAEVKKYNLKKVGLLGTKFTMERDFFSDRLAQQSIDVIIPEDDDRAFIHYTIFEELGRNIVLRQTKDRYIRIVNKLISKGAEGVILGCTEIPLLIQPEDASVPVFDTTKIHAAAAVDFSLG